MNEKFILDACCGSRMFWFNKNHPNTLYTDKRLEVNPDIQMDFMDLKFDDKSFKLVIFDPPHIIQEYNPDSFILKSYGVLNPKTWKSDIKKGFDECWRVLEDYGILIFKWNSRDWDKRTKEDEIINIIGIKPLIKNVITKDAGLKRNYSKTYWFVFMKIPEDKIAKEMQE